LPSAPTKKVLLHHPGAEAICEAVLSRYPELQLEIATDDTDFARKLVDTAIIIGQRFDPSPLRNARALEWLHVTLAGVDFLAPVKHYLGDAVVTNARGIIADHIANYVIGAIVHLRWDFPAIIHNQDAKVWRRWATEPLSGQVACIVGVGAIGQEIANRVTAMGMTAVGVRESGLPAPGLSRVFGPHELEDALSIADFVVLALPSTPRTARLIGSGAFKAMKRSAFLINIARGAVVDETALVAALEHKLIAGACLDVFVEEPLPDSSLLWRFPNVTISPHSSGLTTDYDQRNAALIVDNLERYRSNQPLRNVVDLSQAL
jgi:phosphoglycerate dehydrogenase-like enzyme